MSFFLVKLHITEARSLARSRLCCPTRQHLTGPVRVPLRPSPSNLSISGFAAGLFHPDDERPCGVQVLRFVSIIACRRPYSGFPIGAHSHCFPIGIGLRPSRRGSACIRVKPGLSLCTQLSQQYASGVTSHGAAAFIFVLRPANLVGVTDWVSPMASELTISNSGLPCRGKFRRDVTTPTRPLPIQPNGILLNQTPFILEETNFKPRTRPSSRGGRV